MKKIQVCENEPLNRNILKKAIALSILANDKIEFGEEEVASIELPSPKGDYKLRIAFERLEPSWGEEYWMVPKIIMKKGLFEHRYTVGKLTKNLSTIEDLIDVTEEFILDFRKNGIDNNIINGLKSELNKLNKLN